MEFTGTLLCFWTLTVLFSSSTQEEGVPQNCSSMVEFTQLSRHLERAVDCRDSPFLKWSSQQTAAVLSSIIKLTQALHQHQLTDCQAAEPKKCPEAETPENGGLLCVTINNKRYCKPFCNYGYDFGFLRISRVFDECSEQTGYKWQSQFVGGNKLAVCNKAEVAVAGAKTAYFPKSQDCLITKANSTLQSRVMEEFLSELKSGGLQEEPLNACLVCGLTH